MSQVVVLSIGYNHYVVAAKPGTAGKLLELLSGAVPVRKDYDRSSPAFRDVYTVEPRRAEVTVTIVARDQIRPPKTEEMEGPEAVEFTALPTVRTLKLLKP